MELPSLHQIGDYVNLRLPQAGITEQEAQVIMAEIICVHFYPVKVKYDLMIHLASGHATRIYNVDSIYVFSNVDGSHEENEADNQLSENKAVAVLEFIEDAISNDIIDRKTADALEKYYAS